MGRIVVDDALAVSEPGKSQCSDENGHRRINESLTVQNTTSLATSDARRFSPTLMGQCAFRSIVPFVWVDLFWTRRKSILGCARRRHGGPLLGLPQLRRHDQRRERHAQYAERIGGAFLAVDDRDDADDGGAVGADGLDGFGG